MAYNDFIPEFVVSNLERSRDFYQKLLDFSVVYERPEDKFIFLEKAGIQLMLEEGTPEELAGLTYPFGHGANFSLGVNDIEGIYQRCRDQHYPIKSALEVRRFRVDDKEVTQKEFSLLDPDGYFLRVTD